MRREARARPSSAWQLSSAASGGEQLLVARCLGVALTKRGRMGLRPQRAIGAALRDLDRVVERFREIGEQRRHLVGALEVVLARDAAAFVLRHHAAIGDA